MLTKALVLPTDLLTGGFFPVEVAGLMEVKALECPLLFGLKRAGESRLLAGDEGVKSFFGEEGSAAVGDGEEDMDDWDCPPRRKPLPVNGIMFLMSCDAEPGREKGRNMTQATDFQYLL